MKKDDIIELDITETNALGNGVGKIDGFVVFCLGAVGGDRVRCRVLTVKKNYATAEILEILTASPDRTEPDCASYPECGGCTLRHIDYECEKKAKRASVEAALRRAGIRGVNVSETVSCSPERYRNKAVFSFGDGLLPGFKRAADEQVVSCEDCLICPGIFTECARFTGEFIKSKYPGKTPEYLYLRINSSYDEMTAVLGLGELTCVEAGDWAEAFSEAFPVCVGIMASDGTHPEDKNTVYRILYGREYINESFLSLKLRVSAHSFFQVNSRAAQLLCKKAALLAAPGDGEFGVDLYCGTGVIGMAVASENPSCFVTGVEINANAVKDAKMNAEANRLSNIGFYCKDSAEFAKSTYGQVDFATIDPPRSGCSDRMIKELLRLSPKRLVYVSCDPQTLARDAAVLVSAGYTVESAEPYDLFARTKHVETLMLLTKKLDDTYR